MAFPQLGMFSYQQRLDLTREWKGDRFPDGRPEVPDSILEGLRDVDAEEAWGVLQSHGYKYQFEGGWREINPGGRMVGRVFTAVFMPQRPDVNAVINDKGKAEGRVVSNLADRHARARRRSGGRPFRKDQGWHLRRRPAEPTGGDDGGIFRKSKACTCSCATSIPPPCAIRR